MNIINFGKNKSIVASELYDHHAILSHLTITLSIETQHYNNTNSLLLDNIYQ